MSLLNFTKYFIRFVFLQTTLTALTVWYFDTYLIGSYLRGYEIIINNLYEDRLRFYSFIPKDLITIDLFLAFFIFIFLIILYLTDFYSYVNELAFTTNKSLLDEFFPIYLVWTSSFFVFLQLFRFTSVSRIYSLLFTLIVPIFLVSFRNSEFISTLLGRNPTREKYISFNLEEDSIFREIRLLKLRDEIKKYSVSDSRDFNFYKEAIEKTNQDNQINLVVFYLDSIKSLNSEFEKYVLNTNKKILLISTYSLKFKSKFIFRHEFISNKNLIYLNNDIQYGSRYILKRVLDIVFTLLFTPIIFPIILFSSLYILMFDGSPALIRQTRVGLHGKDFLMFKLRTMRKDSHEDREDLEKFNESGGPLFKMKDDPRLIKGAKFLRKYSIDELPQFINILTGSMSLVGPRPLFPEDNKYFDEHYIRRLNVLPGLTGLLQINERNTSDFNVWYKYDIEYIDNWSLFLDIKIIFLTPFSLFRSKTKGK